METTTIAVTNEIKEMISKFGNKSETYSDILLRLIKSARERQLHDLLMDEKDTITIDEALSDARKRWQE